MAVYTNVSREQIEILLESYNIGKLTKYVEIEQGVENSNFFLYTETGKYILTIYEKRVKAEDIPFYLNFMEHLNVKHFPAPLPIKNKNDRSLNIIADKPCAVISFLQGKFQSDIRNNHLEDLGENLANMHLASLDFPMKLGNNFSLESWYDLFDKVKDKADDFKLGIADYIQANLNYLSDKWPYDIPVGVIHGDLFPDNVFFENDKLVGVIDYYFACNDILIYDLAICLNAWCFESHNEFNVTKAKRFLKSYNQSRKITQKELNALPIVASGSALRFLLTRLYDWLNHDEKAIVKPKDPLEYLEKLRFHNGIISYKEYGI